MATLTELLKQLEDARVEAMSIQASANGLKKRVAENPRNAESLKNARAAYARQAKKIKSLEREIDSRTGGAASHKDSTRERGRAVYSESPEGVKQFLLDLRNARSKGDSKAEERLQRNNRYAFGADREQRDVGPTEAQGFAAPAWLGQYFANAVRVAPAIRNAFVEVPFDHGQGWVADIPRVEVGATAGMVDAANPTADISDNSGSVQSADATSNLGVCSGRLVIDLQVYERSDPLGSVVWMHDLYQAMDAVLENQFLNGVASTGPGHVDGLRNVSGIQTYSYTSASPTPAEFIDALGKAKSQFAKNRLAAPTAVIMHPRRMEWAMSSLNASFPAVSMGGYANAPSPDAPHGALLGMRVIPSTVVPTTISTDQDAVVLVKGDDVFWSRSRRYLEYVQDITYNGKLSVQVAGLSYVRLFADRYPLSILDMTGTGLAAPAGF